jgi:hypothetical protein
VVREGLEETQSDGPLLCRHYELAMLDEAMHLECSFIAGVVVHCDTQALGN